MVVVRSGLDPDDALKFNLFSFRKVLWIFLLLSLILVALATTNLFGKDRDPVYSGLLYAAAGLLPVGAYFLVRFLGKKNIRSNAAINGSTRQTFTFDEETVLIEQQGEHMTSSNRFDWTVFYKVEVSGEYFYLYISNMNSLVMKCGDIVEGTLEELDDLFARKLGARYKRKKAAS